MADRSGQAANCVNHHFRDRRHSQVGRANTRLIEQPIHAHECLSRREMRREVTFGRKAVLQTERGEQRLSDDVEMGEPASGEMHQPRAEARRRLKPAPHLCRRFTLDRYRAEVAAVLETARRQ